MMLAMSLGMTVGELSVRMGAAELAQWMELLRVEPWGPYRQDALALRGWFYSVAGPHASPRDLAQDMRLPWVDRVEEVQMVTPEQMRAALLAMGGRIVEA